jgi:CheY-like chemotaxis protein
MNLSGLVETLRKAGFETYVDDLLDAFWLAEHLEGQSFYEPSPVAGQPAAPTEPAPHAEREAGRQPTPTPPPSVERLHPERQSQETPIYPLGRTEAPHGRRASILSVPAARALPNGLSLARALRPFTRRWRSTTSVEIDEEGTVDATASLGFFYAVLRPALERWYSVDMVVEDDPAIDVWRPMLREFCHVLQNTGAFQDVRQWQLRLRPPEAGSTRFGVMLETSEGADISPQFVAGTGTRRLILFATHGSSVHWSDGAYKQVLVAWLPTATVALLQVLPNHRWKRTALGGAQGACHTARPGLASSLLDAEPFWSALPAEEDASFVPIISLEARDIVQFADMQMGRGRSAPIVFLDSSRADAAAERGEAEEDVERIIAALKAESPDAFRLAVYLSSGPFTLPVARLIQEVKLGSDSAQSALGDILLSGLVMFRFPEGERNRPEEVLYEFRAEGRAILMRSLRRREAQLLAHELEDEMSRYISAVSDRAEKFAVQFPDEMGPHRLPDWLRPFARVVHSLRGEPATRADALALVQQFRARASAAVMHAMELARRFDELAFDRAAVDEEILRTLAGGGLIRQDVRGQWRFSAGVSEALRSLAAQEAPLEAPEGGKVEALEEVSAELRVSLPDAAILWVDDQPGNHASARATLTASGAFVSLALSTDDAVRALAEHDFDAIISAFSQADGEFAALELLQGVRQRSNIPYAVYSSGRLSRRQTDEAERLGATICTIRFNEVQAALESAMVARAPRNMLSGAQTARLRELLKFKGWPESLLSTASAAWEAVWRTVGAIDRIGPEALDDVDAVASTRYCQLFRVKDDQISLVASRIASGGASYDLASWDGIIGRAARTGRTIHVADVLEDNAYIPAETSTRSELAIPIRIADSKVVGVINIESSRLSAFSGRQARWLEEFASSLSSFLSEPRIPELRKHGISVPIGSPSRARRRVAVVIGVNQVGGLPPLEGSVFGAKAVSDWLVLEAFEVRTITDESGPVDP